jgi:hypothetical protein
MNGHDSESAFIACSPSPPSLLVVIPAQAVNNPHIAVVKYLFVRNQSTAPQHVIRADIGGIDEYG